jgi:hypothetical protein
MTPKVYRLLTAHAVGARCAAHADSVFAAAMIADAAQRMALALGALDEQQSMRYFDLISNAIRVRSRELKADPNAPHPWLQVK